MVVAALLCLLIQPRSQDLTRKAVTGRQLVGVSAESFTVKNPLLMSYKCSWCETLMSWGNWHWPFSASVSKPKLSDELRIPSALTNERQIHVLTAERNPPLPDYHKVESITTQVHLKVGQSRQHSGTLWHVNGHFFPISYKRNGKKNCQLQSKHVAEHIHTHTHTYTHTTRFHTKLHSLTTLSLSSFTSDLGTCTYEAQNQNKTSS